MTHLAAYLAQHTLPEAERDIVLALARAGKYVNAAVRLRDTFKDGSANASGDTQSSLDITSDAIFVEHLTDSGVVRTIGSEERDELVICADARADYFVAFDPYDGGSVGDANITFGSIVGVWADNPLGAPDGIGTQLRIALTILYGPRVTLLLALPEAQGVALFELDEVGEFLLVRDNITIDKHSTYFAPGNLKACATSPAYRALVDHWITGGSKLRYAGALVTDIGHMLLKGGGIFAYPADDDYPQGRLRLLYEGAPLAYMLARAGGVGVTTDGTPLLDVVATTPHQRTTLLLGSPENVRTALDVMHTDR